MRVYSWLRINCSVNQLCQAYDRGLALADLFLDTINVNALRTVIMCSCCGYGASIPSCYDITVLWLAQTLSLSMRHQFVVKRMGLGIQ